MKWMVIGATVSEEIHTKFHAWCKKNNTKPNEVIKEYIEYIIIEEN
jgi:hypothetical protein